MSYVSATQMDLSGHKLYTLFQYFLIYSEAETDYIVKWCNPLQRLNVLWKKNMQ